jgi:hypothetical protein
MASEVASVGVEGSAADFVATSVATSAGTEEALVVEGVSATKEEAASVDAADTKADLLLQTHPAAPVEEAALAQATTTDVMDTEDEGRLGAIMTLSAVVTEGMRTETETETETRTVIDMAAADATTTMGQENDSTRATGTMTPDNAEGIKRAHPISCVKSDILFNSRLVGWVSCSLYHKILEFSTCLLFSTLDGLVRSH